MSVWGEIRKKSLGQEKRLEDWGTIKRTEEDTPPNITVVKNRYSGPSYTVVGDEKELRERLHRLTEMYTHIYKF